MGSIKFGTDGWRSIIADDFTFSNVSLVTKAIGAHLTDTSQTKRGIFIGYDNRFLSEEFSDCAAKVLRNAGINVFIANEPVPTPLTAYMVTHMGLDGALMFTASHNPPKYNGIKFIPHYGGPAGEDITKEIEKKLHLLESGKDLGSSSKKGQINQVSDFESYTNRLLEAIDKNRIQKALPKIAADTMFGAGSKLFPKILQDDLGLDALVFRNWRDPLFGGMLPEPSENNLKNLVKCIGEKKLDLGLALDGDADRFGVIDGKGTYINPNNVISLILYYLTETGRYEKGDTAVRTLATTHLVDAICAHHQLQVLETPVGFKHIAKAMLEGHVLIGGEESGGLSIKGHIPEKDGLLANLLVLEIQSYLKLKQKGPFLSDYLAEIYNKFGTFYNLRLDLEVPQERKTDILEFFSSLKQKGVEGNKVRKINRADGVKLIFEKHKSWLLARPSGTEPLIRCYIEATDARFFEVLKNFVEKNIQNFQ